MTEASVVVSGPKTGALVAMDVWSHVEVAAARVGQALGGVLPALGYSAPLSADWRAIRVEPTVWWLTGPLDDVERQLDRINVALAEGGGTIDLSGAYATITAKGPACRALLMFGGVFDAEAADFGPGRTAGTLLHHASVRYDVTEPGEVRILVAPSHADDLLHHLNLAASRLDAQDA